MSGGVFQGSLFTSDFLTETIAATPEWRQISDADSASLAADLRTVFAGFPTTLTPNESQTEDDLIWPVLNRLGWTASLRQQNLAARGRDDVPDGLLFQDDAGKAVANGFADEWKRYGFGLAIVESKRWQRPLDRQSGRHGEETAPSTQMLRYLRRVEDLTTGKLRWGILTNGSRWRLYYGGARSVSEQFFELDLAAVLGIAGHDGELAALSEDDRRHWLKVFALVFRRDAFVRTAPDPRTFHLRAIDEGKFYEQRVAANLSDLVFGSVFPRLAQAIAGAAPAAPLQEVREAALILLYRLLFILYAEDRDLLPVGDDRYADYSFREKVRADVGRHKDRNDTFSETAARYWSVLDDLCRAINSGDRSVGLPPYNGGLFDAERTPLLARVRLGDEAMAEVIDALSFEHTSDGRKYINYRDLSVQQLGSIYERLLEHEITRTDDVIHVSPNIFARKGSGSYYTPDELVLLIVRETIEPLVSARLKAFADQVHEQEGSRQAEDLRLGTLAGFDPAERLLELKICDPAMGSGHFLVSLVDYLADHVITAMAEAQALVTFGNYVSPLIARIAAIRTTILRNAGERGWTIDPSQLDDRHIVRRMVLKRCIYGVDKNQMAVELAKVSLWLHTFTVGAPLSFLDHHLRCGDSLFGSWVRGGIDRASAFGAPLLLHGPMTRALRAASKMQIIEGLTDAEIAEAHRSKDVFDEVQEMTAPLDAFLALIHALDWLNIARADRPVLTAFFDGQFGDPFEIALGRSNITSRRADATRFAQLLGQARELVTEESFLNWQVAYPGVWIDWEQQGLSGGFDAVIGNPPWDRMKLQQVEWFATRRPQIALATRAADRARMIADLEAAEDPLWKDFAKANDRAEAATRIARKAGDYPLLSSNDVNLYSLFVERAMSLVKPSGMVGLLVPSGIASDLTAAKFFKRVSTEGRLKALYDFENGRQGTEYPPYFPDVHRSFKFCALVASPSPFEMPAECAFFLHDVAELNDPDRRFPFSAEDFSHVNPNTGTAPIFRSRRDASLTTAIYARLPALVDRSSGVEVKAWPVKYSTMFHMTNDSGLFRTRAELEEQEGAWPTGGNRFGSRSGDWVPLYVGRMVHQFDHRAASVEVNEANVHNAAFSGGVTAAEKASPTFSPTPQFWVPAQNVDLPTDTKWAIGFRDIARSTDVRTMIAAAVPSYGFGNTLPILKPEEGADFRANGYLLLANLNSLIFDFVTRQKAQSTHLNWYIVEQLPVVTAERFATVTFGSKTAASVVRDAVLELTYTASDMAPFARDIGYVDAAGEVRPPFVWNDDRRLHLRAKLDAIFFNLYGVTDRADVRYIYSTFPIVEREEAANFNGHYRSRDLCLAYMNVLAAGQPDAPVTL
jgi:hypothetical protein